MKKISELFDEYSFKARLLPAFLVLLPFALAALAWSPLFWSNWNLLGAILVYCGGTFFLAQLGRDLGRSKEKKLFVLWGGKPTTRLLRHRQNNLDKITLSRYHLKMKELLGKEPPTKEQEAHNKKDADEFYEAGVRVLLERTRDQTKFPLVFKENVNYGFRRNLWGMKPAAIFICCLSLITCLMFIAMTAFESSKISVLALACTVCNIILLTWWLLRINPDWVKLPAEAFALRLLASIEQI